jgi:RNA polymerase sigma-70 factor (ECF subfamily)
VEIHDGRIDLETTATLLAQARAGDFSARDRLLRRYLPILKRWAHGRLPAPARDLCDTDDLVQVTLLRAFDQMNRFEPRREGAFMAYLRQILINKVRDEIRRATRVPAIGPIERNLRQSSPSPLEGAIGRELLESYEAALAKLPETQREAAVLRLEMGFTHQQVADALVLPSANAARMLVARALVKLAEVMDGQAGR